MLCNKGAGRKAKFLSNERGRVRGSLARCRLESCRIERGVGYAAHPCKSELAPRSVMVSVLFVDNLKKAGNFLEEVLG